MATTAVSFDDFFEALSDSYAIEIDDMIMPSNFENEIDEELGEAVVIHDEWNGGIRVPQSMNPVIEFDTIGRTYSVKGFSSSGGGEFIETFSIRFLKLA